MPEPTTPLDQVAALVDTLNEAEEWRNILAGQLTALGSAITRVRGEVRALRDLTIAAALAGENPPSKRALAKRFGVSRGTIINIGRRQGGITPGVDDA